MSKPLVSVLMTLLNDEKYIASAIDSVLQQTYTNLELVIVLDAGSSDSSHSIITSYDDPRIHLFVNETRLGLVNSLNYGLSLCKGDYIAWLDSDDICLPNRLETQVRFMECTPGCMLCGSYYQTIDQSGHIMQKRLRVPSSHEEIHLTSFFHNPFANSSIMFRSCLANQYAFSYRDVIAEDYDFNVRIMLKYQTYNIPKILIQHRLHADNRTEQCKHVQATSDYEIQKYLWETTMDMPFCITHPLYSRPDSEDELYAMESVVDSLMINHPLTLSLYKVIYRNTSNLYGKSRCKRLLNTLKFRKKAKTQKSSLPKK